MLVLLLGLQINHHTVYFFLLVLGDFIELILRIKNLLLSPIFVFILTVGFIDFFIIVLLLSVIININILLTSFNIDFGILLKLVLHRIALTLVILDFIAFYDDFVRVYLDLFFGSLSRLL